MRRPSRHARRTRAYDPTFDSAILLGVGTAHAVEGPSESRGPLRGHLIIPDVDERRGWREWYVYGEAPAKPTRPLGFVKPGAER